MSGPQLSSTVRWPLVSIHAAVTLSKLTGLSLDRSRKLVNAIYRRKPVLRWLPAIVDPGRFGG